MFYKFVCVKGTGLFKFVRVIYKGHLTVCGEEEASRRCLFGERDKFLIWSYTSLAGTGNGRTKQINSLFVLVKCVDTMRLDADRRVLI